MRLPPWRRRVVLLAIAGACAAGTFCASAATAPPASAFNPLKPICDAAGFLSGLVGKACSIVQHGESLLKAGKQLLNGHLGGAAKAVFGAGGATAETASTALGLAALLTWVLGGAKYALGATASVIAETTTPELRSTWFSSTYWRVAAIAAVLTLPFLFAAAIQAVMQSDLALLVRAIGQLPLAMLAVGIAAPLTTLLLAASDQMSAFVSSAAGDASGHFLQKAIETLGGAALISTSPFLVFFAGLLTVAGAVVLWLELLVREAAVYVIVLMLPLFFAALVWPARRVWAIRAVELLVALILSKFAMVAVLALGGEALDHSAPDSVTGLLAGFVLLVMGAFAPWALLRMLPLTELASGAAGSLRRESGFVRQGVEPSDAAARRAHDLFAEAPPRERGRGSHTRAGTGEDGAQSAAQGLAALAQQGQRHSTGSDENQGTPSGGSTVPEAAGDRATGAPSATNRGASEAISDRGREPERGPRDEARTPHGRWPIRTSASDTGAALPPETGPPGAAGRQSPELWRAEDFTAPLDLSDLNAGGVGTRGPNNAPSDNEAEAGDT